MCVACSSAMQTLTRKRREQKPFGVMQWNKTAHRIACRQEWTIGTDGTCLTKSAKKDEKKINSNKNNTKTACAMLALSRSFSLPYLSIASIHRKYSPKVRSMIPNFESFELFRENRLHQILYSLHFEFSNCIYCNWCLCLRRHHPCFHSKCKKKDEWWCFE